MFRIQGSKEDKTLNILYCKRISNDKFAIASSKGPFQLLRQWRTRSTPCSFSQWQGRLAML